jgi:hypothetical protein
VNEDFGLGILEGIELGAWSIEQAVKIQNPEFRRKAIKIQFLSATITNYLFVVLSA